MSESFYKVKESMIEQHKKFLAELKKIYDDSLKNFKREEGEAAKKVIDINKEYLMILSNLKSAKSDLSEARKEKADIDAQITVLRREKADFDALKAKEQEGFKEHIQQIVLDTQKLDEKSKVETIRIQNREKELLGIKTDGEVILKRNEIILSAIKKADEDLTIKIQRFEDAKKEVSDTQDKLSESIKISNKVLNKIEEEQEKCQSDKEKNVIDRTELNKKDGLLKIREQQLGDRENKLDDRELEQDIRDNEFLKKEKRVNNLIEAHKLKI